jgi:hypothetical protein
MQEKEFPETLRAKKQRAFVCLRRYINNREWMTIPSRQQPPYISPFLFIKIKKGYVYI